MRIALITTSFPSTPGDPAGHFVQTEATELASEGHEVHVIAPGSGVPQHAPETPTVWRAGGGTLFGWPGALARARENPLRLLGLGEFLVRAKRHLSRLGSIDRIVAHFVIPCGYPLSIATGGELDVVLHGSDVALLCSFPARARTRVARQLLDRGARFRFVSERLRTRLLDRLGSLEREALAARSRVEPAHISLPAIAGVDVQRCRAILGRGDRPRWVACARLVDSKRIDLAMREAQRRGAELTVIGDGPLRAPLEKLARANQPSARFLGQLPRHEALAFIAAADKLIHTSASEGAPTVIREARALGIPVLATPCGDVDRWAEIDAGIELLPPA